VVASRPRRSERAHQLSRNPRRHALEIISQALRSQGGGFARELLDERLSRARLKVEDARLATDLTYGVIRRLATLDAVLEAYASKPVAEMDPAVRQILRLGAYQLLFLERVPDHAVVDESVRLARATGKERATGFVNGVLRAIARDVTFSEQPDATRPRRSFEMRTGRACTFGRQVFPSPTRLAAWLAATESFAEWLLGRWLARYGASRTRRLCAVANRTPPLFARPNRLRTSAEQLVETLREEKISAGHSPSGRTLRLPPHTIPARLRSFRRGLFQIQDDASAAAGPFLAPQPGETVLDLCAAPGGKTCHLAELMEERGRIVAVDSSKRRLRRLLENVQRLDHRIIAVVASDAADFAIWNRAQFDRVLLDVPCSNTGVLRRRVEARWRLSDKALAALVKQQRNLLTAALRAVKPGGVLVYSTCSLEPEENGELVASVLGAAPEFHLDAEKQFLPEADGGDGLYMARIVRGDSPQEGRR